MDGQSSFVSHTIVWQSLDLELLTLPAQQPAQMVAGPAALPEPPMLKQAVWPLGQPAAGCGSLSHVTSEEPLMVHMRPVTSSTSSLGGPLLESPHAASAMLKVSAEMLRL